MINQTLRTKNNQISKMIAKSTYFFIPLKFLRINTSKQKKKGEPTQIEQQLYKGGKSTTPLNMICTVFDGGIHKPWHVLITICPVFLYFHHILVCFSCSIVKYHKYRYHK